MSLKAVTDPREAGLTFDAQGLLPAVVQDRVRGEVLMVAYMNREALEKTLATGRTWFYSRSRRELWEKGRTSGNVQEVTAVFFDCDADTLLVLVEAAGPACHKGSRSCFQGLLARREGEERAGGAESLAAFPFALEDIIGERRRLPGQGSYVASLFERGLDAMLKKVGEEAGEVIIAAKNGGEKELVHEGADLLFHLLLVLNAQGVEYRQVLAELVRRHRSPRTATGSGSDRGSGRSGGGSDQADRGPDQADTKTDRAGGGTGQADTKTDRVDSETDHADTKTGRAGSGDGGGTP